ncbi:zf-HC2 domain-containing protein [bacterium]|nr:zf-HC2 domain-containing protein [bacterium]
MKCRTIKRKLSAYMDGEIDKNQKTTIEVHLKQCVTCQQVLHDLNTTWSLLSLLPESESVPYFFARLNARIKSEKTKKRSIWIDRVLIPVTATIVTILGIFTGSFVGKNGESLAEQTVEDEMISTLHLDSFDDFQTASLGEVYFDLVSQE